MSAPDQHTQHPVSLQAAVASASVRIRDLLDELRSAMEATGCGAVNLTGAIKIVVPSPSRQTYTLRLAHEQQKNISALSRPLEVQVTLEKILETSVDADPVAPVFDPANLTNAMRPSSPAAGTPEPPPQTRERPVEEHNGVSSEHERDASSSRGPALSPTVQRATSQTLQHSSASSSTADMAADISRLQDELRSLKAKFGPDTSRSRIPSMGPPVTEDTVMSSVHQELQTISKQIRWVEECRRVAAESYDLREEKWRTTSATFHDGNRQRQEKFEEWLASEVNKQGAKMTEILASVKELSSLTYSLKWETPVQPPMPTTAPVPVQHRSPVAPSPFTPRFEGPPTKRRAP